MVLLELHTFFFYIFTVTVGNCVTMPVASSSSLVSAVVEEELCVKKRQLKNHTLAHWISMYLQTILINLQLTLHI